MLFLPRTQPAASATAPDATLQEFLSATFVALLERAFQSPNPLLGTVLYRPHPVADRFRQAPGVELIEVTRQNRDALPAELARRLSAAVVRPTRR